MKNSFLILASVLALACGPKPAQPPTPETSPSPEAAAPSAQHTLGAPDPSAGKILFERNCSTCHGMTGVGDGPAAAALTPKPRNLKETAKNDEELKRTISGGGAAVGLSPVMPAWGAMLSEQDIANVIAYIHQLKGS